MLAQQPLALWLGTEGKGLSGGQWSDINAGSGETGPVRKTVCHNWSQTQPRASYSVEFCNTYLANKSAYCIGSYRHGSYDGVSERSSGW